MPIPSPAPLRGITARAADGTVVDVTFVRGADGVVLIAGVEPAQDAGGHRSGWLDLPGHVLLPAAAEPHAHLDKALSWPVIAPPPGDLHAAVDAWRAGSARLDEESFHTRARTTAIEMLGNGITAVRTHVDVLAGADPMRAVRAVDRVRRELAGVMTIQIVVLAAPRTPLHVVAEALGCGADLIGGAPHLADDPAANLDALLSLAEAHGVGADLHIDEFTDGDHLTIGRYADRVASWPDERVRTAGHCSRLATMAPAQLHDTVAALRRARVSVVALPITNLYLQGRDGPSAGCRAITAIDELRAGGVLVAAGADNVRDPFNPVGRADPLETASLLVTAAHQRPADAVDLVTNAARQVIGLPAAGIETGARADLFAVRGDDLVHAVAAAPADRAVIVNGSLVSRTETHTWTATSVLQPQ
ncbi:MAG: cytosine deaminase [Gordonia sp. (in: high G+C Gram-positive bacteria)]